MSRNNDNDLTQNFLGDDDDDDLDSRHRANTLDTIDEEGEDDNSEADVQVIGEALSPKPTVDSSVGTATLVGSTFQLANCAIGAGVLAFPYAFANCGLAIGPLLLVYLALTVGVTQLVVIKASAETGAASYEDMVRIVLGKGWGTVLEVVVLLYQFGACVAYLDVVADQGTSIMCAYGYSTFGDLCDGSQFLLRAILVAAIAFGFCLPFSIPRRIDTLAKISMVGVLAPMIMSTAIVVLGVLDMTDRGLEQVFYKIKWVPDSQTGVHDVLKSVPIILFALQSHIVTPSVYQEMKPEIKSVKNLSKGMFFAYTMVLSVYMIVGIFGYTQFGNGVDGDLLKTNTVLSRSRGAVLQIVINAARGCIAVGALCSFPLNHFPGRSALFNLVVKKEKQNSLPTWAFYVEATAFVAVCYGLAVAVPQISYVFSIMGATCGTGVMFIFPAMMHLALPRYRTRIRLRQGSQDTFDDYPGSPEAGSMVDVASGRKAVKVEDVIVSGGKAKKQKRECCCRWFFFVAFMVVGTFDAMAGLLFLHSLAATRMTVFALLFALFATCAGVFVVITGTMSAVQDLITNLIN